jgi:hypothetical protein
MNEHAEQTNEPRLRELLREARPAPPLPPRFQEAVWRRIAETESAADPAGPLTWLDLLVERLLRPRIALAGLVALLLIGGLAGVASGQAAARQAAQARYLASVAPQPLH